MKKPNLKSVTIAIISGLIFLTQFSCKDTVENILPKENPYKDKLSWTGYIGNSGSGLFNGAFNEVNFNFDKEKDGKTYGVIIENKNASQLSLQRMTVMITNINNGTYNINDPANGRILYYKDYTKTTEFTEMKGGTITVDSTSNKELIDGKFDCWGISGTDTVAIQGSFYRKKL